MTMKDWSEKLDAFLKFNEQDILEDLGKTSHEEAKTLAEKEYNVFRTVQDRDHKSDFDKLFETTKHLETHAEKILEH